MNVVNNRLDIEEKDELTTRQSNKNYHKWNTEITALKQN